MRLNIITEPGWIMRRCAEELRDRLPIPVEINGRGTDLVYHLPYWRGLDDAPECETRAGFFTHGDDRARRCAGRFDAHVCMNRRMKGLLWESGAEVVRVIQPGVDPPARLPRFGVVGRVYRDRRKGQELVERAAEHGYDISSCGPGPWPCESFSEDLGDLEAFYGHVDYLVVPGLEEGGPMPVPEAIAHHVPVIAPDVGWCWEFPVIRYRRGSWMSLKRVLDQLSRPPTWAQWAERHRDLFSGLSRGVVA